MKTVTQPWRDPAFYGFLLFGLALLSGSFACVVQARTEQTRPRTRPVVAGSLTRPSAFSSSLNQPARKQGVSPAYTPGTQRF
ncbi:MAG: hypothetical protein HZB16_07760 [Armatimonadetes bacterium]|nr:hypothetical protein [Armatimonadota bacterium]